MRLSLHNSTRGLERPERIFPSSFPAERLEKIADDYLAMCVVAKRQVGIDAVLDSPAYSFLADISTGIQVGEYPAYRALGGAYRCG